MRHYFGYDIDGNLRSYESYGPTGWPHTHCMEDPNCEEASVQHLRDTRARTDPYIIDFIVYDCPCDPAQGALLEECTCVPPKKAESYVDVETKTIKTKPARSVYIDDVLVENEEIVTKTPGTQVKLKLVCMALPDGTKANCSQRGAVDLTLDDAWEMTFTSGITEEKTLTAPAQGTKGVVTVYGSRIVPLRFALRGFEGA